MLPHYVEAYKATDEGREWAEEEEQADSGAERECLCSTLSLSVTLCPSNYAAAHTNTHTAHARASPDHLSPHFETLKMWLSEGSVADRLL